MWKYFGVILVEIALMLTAELTLPLEPPPEKFKNTEGCYIKELDKMVKVGNSTPSSKECFTYLCGKKDVIVVGCDLVETSPPCKIIENKSLPYPACCPNIQCETKPILKSLKALHVLGIDVLKKKQGKIHKDQPGKPDEDKKDDMCEDEDDKKNLFEKVPGAQPQIMQPANNATHKTKKHRIYSDLRALQVLGADLLDLRSKKDSNQKAKDGKVDIQEPIGNKEHQETEPAQPQHVTQDTVTEIVNDKVNDTVSEKIPQLKALSILGQDLLGKSPINLGTYDQKNDGGVAKDKDKGKGKGTGCSTVAAELLKNQQHEVDRLKQDDVLVFYKRVGA